MTGNARRPASYDAQTRFGSAVRRARLELRLSQVDLAEIAEMPQRVISTVEQGKGWPQADRVVDLCVLLDIDLRKI